MLIVSLSGSQTGWSVSLSFAAFPPETILDRRKVAFRATTAGGSEVRGDGVVGYLPSISTVSWMTVTGTGELEQTPG